MCACRAGAVLQHHPPRQRQAQAGHPGQHVGGAQAGAPHAAAGPPRVGQDDAAQGPLRPPGALGRQGAAPAAARQLPASPLVCFTGLPRRVLSHPNPAEPLPGTPAAVYLQGGNSGGPPWAARCTEPQHHPAALKALNAALAQLDGGVTYNGRALSEFCVERTATYIECAPRSDGGCPGACTHALQSAALPAPCVPHC